MAGDDTRSRRHRRRAGAGFALVLALTLLVGGGGMAAGAGSTTRVSVGSGDPGAQAALASRSPSLSADGRVVAFESDAELARGPAGSAFHRADALTFEKGENFTGVAVIDPAGAFAYFSTTTSPAQVVKIDLVTFERVAAITMEAGSFGSAVIDPAGAFAYFGTWRTGTGEVVKIDLTTFEWVDTIILGDGEGHLHSAVIDPAGRFAYFGTHTSPGRVVKVDLTTFERVGAISFDADDGDINSALIDPAGAFAYFGLETSPGTLVKVDLSTFTRVDALEFADADDSLLYSAVIDPAGRFAYYGHIDPGWIVKVDLARFERVGAITAPPELTSAVMDPGGAFAYFGTDSKPGRIVKVDLAAFEAVDLLTLDTGEDTLLPHGGVIDPAGEFAYFGTQDAAPGRVVKVALAAEGDPEAPDVFVRDRVTHTTTLATPRTRCVGEFCPAGGDAVEPSISADGRFVAFTSRAQNLQLAEPVEGLGKVSQVYVRDLQEGTTRVASLDQEGAPADRESSEPSTSADGRYVAFRSDATLTDDASPAGGSQVYIRDLQLDETSLVSVHGPCADPVVSLVPPAGFGSLTLPTCGGNSFHPSVSASGRYVAFGSAAADLLIEDDLEVVPSGLQVYIRDRVTNTTRLVSMDPATGMPADDSSHEPSISGDGRYVAFWTFADNLGHEPEGCERERDCSDVLVWDRVLADGGTNPFRVASMPADDVRAGHLRHPAMSGDGSALAFVSYLAGESCVRCATLVSDIYRQDLLTGQTVVASLDDEGNQVFGNNLRPAISGDGASVAFDSVAALVAGDTNEQRDVFVHDRGVARATVAPSARDFGEQLVGATSPARVVTVRSTGTAPLETSTVTVAGPHASDFGIVANSCGARLEPGQACMIAVAFTPSEEGGRAATLRVSNNAADSPQRVALRGVGTVPALAVTPDEVAFGGTPVGEVSLPAAVTAVSTGSGPVDIGAVTVTGPHTGDFGVVDDACSDANLPPTAGCAVLVEFSPSEVGPRTATLTLPSSAPDSPHTVRLAGEGTAGQLVLSPDPVDFGAVAAPGGRAERVATATNVGTASLQVSAVSLVGADAGAFTVIADTCTGTDLAPLAGCMVTVRFAAPALGLFEAGLSATHTAPGSPVRTTLRGVGVMVPPAPPPPPPRPGPSPSPGPGPIPDRGVQLLSIRPDTADFGPRLAGADDDTTTMTVTSVGTVSARVTDIVVEGPQAPAFDIVEDGCSETSLRVGASCEVTVAFAPVDSGSHVAELVVRGPDVAPVSATLRGTGLVPLLEVDPPLGRRGFVATATGRDFPADTIVQLVWEPGIGRVLVRSDENGTFEIPILVLRRDRVGPRTLVATAPDVSVTADYLVVPGRQLPPDFVNRS